MSIPYRYLAFAALVIGLTLWWIWPRPDLPMEAPARERIPVLNGEFIVVVRSSGSAPVFRFPGQGGDRPGRVTIYRKDGLSCGSANVPIVGNFTLDYNEERLEASVERPPLKVWDLRKCQSRVK